MKRREDWAEQLAQYLDDRRDAAFAWGVQDCATFAAGAVRAMTGQTLDIPRVESADAYARLVREHGPLADQVAELLGAPLPSPAFAQRGDVVLVAIGGRETLGVCIGAEAAAPAAEGLLMVPMATASAAWRV